MFHVQAAASISLLSGNVTQNNLKTPTTNSPKTMRYQEIETLDHVTEEGIAHA